MEGNGVGENCGRHCKGNGDVRCCKGQWCWAKIHKTLQKNGNMNIVGGTTA